jgi:hypothetical protein
MLRLLARPGADCYLRKNRDQACVPTLRDIAQSAQPEPL